jgi:hypothetical protein
MRLERRLRDQDRGGCLPRRPLAYYPSLGIGSKALNPGVAGAKPPFAATRNPEDLKLDPEFTNDHLGHNFAHFILNGCQDVLTSSSEFIVSRPSVKPFASI